VHCRRPIAAHFTTCPFCKGDQPARVAKAEPIKCPTCKRPYNPALETCPFCAQQTAGYRDATAAPPVPRHDEYKEARKAFEEEQSKVRAALLWSVLGIVMAALFAIALSSKVHVVGSGHLGTVGAVAFVGGIAAAFIGPRFVELEGPELGRRVTFFVGGWVAALSVGYLVIATAMLVLAGAPVRVECKVTSHSYAKRSMGAPATTRYACTLPDGGVLSGSEAHPVMPFAIGRAFTLQVRRTFGNWLYEPDSVIVANPVVPEQQ
jgi:hypothetical protein